MLETPGNAAAIIESLDEAMDASISAKDVETLETFLGEDFVYTHSTERSDPREAFLAWVANRTPNSRRELSDVHVELHGDVAVTRATSTSSTWTRAESTCASCASTGIRTAAGS
jgi:ketosteroid isomerase-like protein